MIFDKWIEDYYKGQQSTMRAQHTMEVDTESKKMFTASNPSGSILTLERAKPMQLFKKQSIILLYLLHAVDFLFLPLFAAVMGFMYTGRSRLKLTGKHGSHMHKR